MNKKIKVFLERLLLGTVFCACLGLCFLAAECLYEYNSPEAQAQRVLITQGGRIKRALFSPDDNPQEILCTLIQAEREKISIAAFSFTNSIIAQELVKAKKRGVVVEIIADGQNSINEYSKIPFLKENKIALWIYPSEQFHENTPRSCVRAYENLMCNACPAEPDESLKIPAAGIMHDKFMIFKRSLLNKSILWTGSYNFTRSANNKNQENVIVTEDPDLIKSYREQFEKIKQRCIRLAVET